MDAPTVALLVFVGEMIIGTLLVALDFSGDA